MRTMTKVAAVLVLVGAGALAGTPAQAVETPVGFGQHVVMCAQNMGFSGTHNPGMHQGAAGWQDMDHMCSMS